MNYQIFIPVRLGSSRLPNKPLIDICGKTVIQRAIEQCPQRPVLVCPKADAAALIKSIDRSVKFDLILTNEADEEYCHCGTDRIAVAVKRYPNLMEGVDFAINFQGDNIAVPKETWKKLELLNVPTKHDGPFMCTLYRDVYEKARHSDSAVYTIRGAGCLLVYFTRHWLPYAYRHCGVYTFNETSLWHFHWLRQVELEKQERLEQLRFIHYRLPIYGLPLEKDSQWIDINTTNDIIAARIFFR